jgi:GntR family transcriptional regulator/MocR family aminotransferase
MLVPLDLDLPTPLHRQLEQHLRDAIRSGRFGPASLVPSTRSLARQLGVSRGVVVEAYEQLAAEGYLLARPGGSTRVAPTATPARPRASAPAAVRFAADFRPGQPDLDEFPRAAWLHSVRRVLNEAPSARMAYLDGRGMHELREALAAYLDRVRGTAARVDDVVVCSGFAQGLRLVAQVLRASGARRIAMEDPSYADAREMVRAAGLAVVGLPIDESGINPELLDRERVDAVIVTPAHQYPTGGVLPPERRAALVAWAVRRRGLIIEDDYDAEFRYDREPIGPIQGLCPDRVVYAGTASKILAPGLRLGWLVAPSSLVEAIAAAKLKSDLGSPAIDQLAFADFVQRGELDRHLRRMRPIYRRRRDTLLAALRRHLPDLRPAGASAGLHLLAWLPPDLDEDAVVRSAGDAGLGLQGLAASRIRPQRQGGGIVFGYGSVTERAISEGVRKLAAVVRTLRAGR